MMRDEQDVRETETTARRGNCVMVRFGSLCTLIGERECGGIIQASPRVHAD